MILSDLFVLLSVSLLLDTIHGALNPANSLVWGPGLDENFSVPARFFFVQAVDSKNNNITESHGADAFTFTIDSKKTQYVRIWTQLLDRQDGSYIARYRLYETYSDLIINIKHRGTHVANSPYLMKGPVYHDDCDCAEQNMEKWLENMNCPATYQQINDDLSSFPKINMRHVNDEYRERFNQPGSISLSHYTVINNKVFRRTQGEHVGFKMFMDSLLLSLSRKVKLPDMEFVNNLGDWPLELEDINPLPILSWCGSDSTKDIVMPTYEITEGAMETMGRQMLDMLSIQANGSPRWKDKIPQAFWRGRDSRQERINLVKMSIRNPDIINASLTRMFFFKHDKDEVGELVENISFFDFFNYKYQLNIDGTVAAYRIPYLLSGGSVVFKQDSEYYEHFYKSLRPFVHYIPFKRDLSDLLDKIQWAKEHDDQAREISLNGQSFARDNLQANDVLCYYVILFRDYAKRLVSKPKIYSDMEFVSQPANSDNCDCQRNIKVKDEL